MKYIYLFSFACILIGLVWILINIFLTRKSNNIPTIKRTTNASFCILIPARNESKVIEPLLKSIQMQSYPILPDAVYVIVENKEDPTVEIVRHYGMNIFIRTEIEGRRRKGYALDEAIKAIHKEYDAYVIVDADNILDQNFLMEMNRTYLEGYDIGIGYRNCKNGNDSVMAACSTLTFSMINTFSNQIRSKKNKNVTVSGTGFFIHGSWIRKWNGYPFHSLTEDYELSLYATLHSLTSAYNEKAIFYDEQPVTYRETVKQRTRWIRGYFDSRKKYVPLLKKSFLKKEKNWVSEYQAYVGVKPYLWMVVGIVIALLCSFGELLYTVFQSGETIGNCIQTILLFFGVVYLILFLFTALLQYLERKKINLRAAMKWKVLLVGPIFFISYVECAIRAFTEKDIGWKVIEHHANTIR